MTDISKKKEDAKKGIRALLISAPLGLTFEELKRDYHDFFGTPLPGKDFGYNSAQEFIQDIPDVAQVQFDGGNLILRAVSDATTKHIEKMVSKQKVDSKKKMAVSARRSAATTRSKSSRPQWLPAPVLSSPYTPPYRRPQYSNNNNRGGVGDRHDAYNSYSHHQQSSNNNYRSMAPRFRQAQHRTVPFVPAHIQNRIHDLVSQHKEGLPLTHFLQIFRVRFGIALNPQQLGFEDEYSMLAGIPSIVALKRFQQGEMRVLPVGAPPNGRIDNKPHTNTTGHKSSSTSPPLRSAEGSRTPSPEELDKEKEEEEDWNQMFDKGTCSNIPQAVQDKIEKLINANPNGIKASGLMFEYKKMYNTDLTMKSYGYNSAIEFVSDLGHIIHTERPNKFDWILYPIKTSSRHQDASDSSPKAPVTSIDKTKDSLVPKKWDSLTPTALAVTSQKVEWEVKEAIVQVLNLNPKGIPMDQFVETYEEMTGKGLNVERYGSDSVKGFLHSLSDVLYIMLDVCDQPVVCSLPEGGPRRFDLLKDKYKPVTPTPVAQPPSKSHHQHIPPQAVTPGCYYKPQTVTYMDTGDSQKSYIEVYVSFTTNPGHFWVQLRGPRTTLALEDLMDLLEEAYGDASKPNHMTKEKDYHISPEMARPGLVCAVIYPEDLYWHRGLITGFKDNLYEVFFVDYGNTCYISLENMRFLKTKFLSLPAQAIRARLSNIQPIKQTWSLRARQQFLDLTRERPLLGFVTAFKNHILSLCLTDTSGQDDIHINDLMTHEGYAVFSPDTEKCLVPEDKETCSQVLTNDFLYGKQQAGTTTEDVSQGAPASQPGGSASGGDGGLWRRYIRQAQMSDDLIFNLIYLGGQDLYLMSSEISSLFFEDDIISAKLRSDKTDISKVVVTKKDYPDLYDELLSYDVSAITNSTALLSLFPLKALPLMMEMYGKEKNLEAIKDIVLTILDWFDPNHPYWRGEDDNSTESGEVDEEGSVTETGSVVSDSRESFKMEDLHMVLKMLQMKRNRSLKKLLEGGEGSNKDAEVNMLTQVEIDIRRMESLIDSQENKKSVNIQKAEQISESNQSVSLAVNENKKSSTSTSTFTAAAAAKEIQPPKSQLSSMADRVIPSLEASSLMQLSQGKPQLSQGKPKLSTSHSKTMASAPVTATVAPTLHHSSMATVNAPMQLPQQKQQPASSSLSSTTTPSMVADQGGLDGMNMAEVLKQQMALNSWLMSQMGMMSSTPMVPSLPLSMEQLQQQQALLQQQMLMQQQQQQQQQLLLRQQQQHQPNLRPPFPSPSLPSSNPQAPGLHDFSPMMRTQFSRLNTATLSSSTCLPTSGTPNYSTLLPNTHNSNSNYNNNKSRTSNDPTVPGSNMFCADLGHVLSSALNDQSRFPMSAAPAPSMSDVNLTLSSDLSKMMNLNK